MGTDTQAIPDGVRFHSDNSVLIRYLNAPGATVTRGAVSLTFDLGVENGGGVSAFNGDAQSPTQQFISGMAYHRLWFLNGVIGWTVGGGYIHNPGRYLVLAPTGAASSVFTIAPGQSFDAWDASTSLDWMPNEQVTWRLELVHRAANVPYFAGHGGVTSPDGYNPTPAGFSPDLVKEETRLVLAFMARF